MLAIVIHKNILIYVQDIRVNKYFSGFPSISLISFIGITFNFNLFLTLFKNQKYCGLSNINFRIKLALTMKIRHCSMQSCWRLLKSVSLSLSEI